MKPHLWPRIESFSGGQESQPLFVHQQPFNLILNPLDTIRNFRQILLNSIYSETTLILNCTCTPVYSSPIYSNQDMQAT